MLRNKQIPLLYLLLTMAALAAFWQVIRCDFINYDDLTYVVENIHIRHGVTAEAIRWAFTTNHASNWHPLTWMSHMLDIQLFGLKPGWHHLTNLLFHVANTLLLFFVFHRMTKAPWQSAFVAALFAIHPLHVESVAWVSERKDVLSAFFWMLTMAAYIHYVEHAGLEARSREQGAGKEKQESRVTYHGSVRGAGRKVSGKFFFSSSVFSYMAVLIFFILGLMAKPMLVTLPFVLLLLDYWPLRRLQEAGSGKRGALETVAGSTEREAGSSKNCSGKHGAGSKQLESLCANKKKGKSGRRAAHASSAEHTSQIMELEEKPAGNKNQWALIRPLLWEKIPLFALAALSCIVTFIAQQKGGAVKSIAAFPLGVRIANAFVAYIIYIGKMVWPDNLAILYPHPGLRPSWQVLAAVMLLGAVTSAVIRGAKRFPYLATGWFWFAGTLVPVIGIVQVGTQAMADRYTYIPLVGLFIMTAWGIPELLRNWQPAHPPRKEVLFASSALVLTCLFIVTWTQAGYWRNSITLYDHALKVTDSNYLVQLNRGSAYGRINDYERAIVDFDKAIEINPGFAEAYYDRGVSYDELGNHRQAVSDYNRAIEINPEYAEAYYNRGVTYAILGNYRQTIEDYDKAIKIDPGYSKAYYNRGVAYDELGNPGQAISDYNRAIEINPDYAKAYYNRGLAYSELDNHGQAISDFNRAVEINPEYADAYNNRGVAYAKLGNRGQAIEDMKTAAKFGNEDARNSLRSMGINW